MSEQRNDWWSDSCGGKHLAIGGVDLAVGPEVTGGGFVSGASMPRPRSVFILGGSGTEEQAKATAIALGASLRRYRDAGYLPTPGQLRVCCDHGGWGEVFTTLRGAFVGIGAPCLESPVSGASKIADVTCLQLRMRLAAVAPLGVC